MAMGFDRRSLFLFHFFFSCFPSLRSIDRVDGDRFPVDLQRRFVLGFTMATGKAGTTDERKDGGDSRPSAASRFFDLALFFFFSEQRLKEKFATHLFNSGLFRPAFEQPPRLASLHFVHTQPSNQAIMFRSGKRTKTSGNRDPVSMTGVYKKALLCNDEFFFLRGDRGAVVASFR